MNKKIDYVETKNIYKTVKNIFNEIKNFSKIEDKLSVIFSPTCASYDQFKILKKRKNI